MRHYAVTQATFTAAAILWGTQLMAQTGQINIEPGKQLPQSVTVHGGDEKSPHEITIRYQLFVPKDYKATGEKWPLLLFLHGLGECSNDDLNKVKIHGPAKIVEGRPDFPFVLVTPQCPPPPGYDPAKAGALTSPQIIELVRRAWNPKELIQLVGHVLDKLNVDPDRVYVTGLSMGGYGTWRLAAAYPDRFAAVVPICGGGDDEMAPALLRLPIWTFHGAKDPIVPIATTQHLVYLIRIANGDIRFTTYPDIAHNSWEQTYNNQEVYDWLLAHRRKPK